MKPSERGSGNPHTIGIHIPQQNMQIYSCVISFEGYFFLYADYIKQKQTKLTLPLLCTPSTDIHSSFVIEHLTKMIIICILLVTL